MSITVKIDPKKAQRLKTFLKSSIYTDQDHDSISKSQYWKHHANMMNVDVDTKGFVHFKGKSGFYVPPSKNTLHRFFNNIKKATNNPYGIVKAIFARTRSQFQLPRFLSYDKAFDAVMNHDPISDPDLSLHRVNHLSLIKVSNVFPDLKSICTHYEKWSKMSVNWNIIYHYYYSNLLRGYIANDSIRTIVEIGSGNGNFPSIMWNDWSPKKIILIDLPETLAITYIFLSSLFPDANILLPNEVKTNTRHTVRHGGTLDNIDFALLTPQQLEIVQSESIDLAINIHSFQEMNHEQIDVYFEFIQRVVRNRGFFFSANRIEKIPTGEDEDPYQIMQTIPPNRFFEYPWKKQNEILINEVSRLNRLVQADAIGIKLERINKL